jgi:hypothetical protein
LIFIIRLENNYYSAHTHLFVKLFLKYTLLIFNRIIFESAFDGAEVYTERSRSAKAYNKIRIETKHVYIRKHLLNTDEVSKRC